MLKKLIFILSVIQLGSTSCMTDRGLVRLKYAIKGMGGLIVLLSAGHLAYMTKCVKGWRSKKELQIKRAVNNCSEISKKWIALKKALTDSVENGLDNKVFINNGIIERRVEGETTVMNAGEVNALFFCNDNFQFVHSDVKKSDLTIGSWLKFLCQTKFIDHKFDAIKEIKDFLKDDIHQLKENLSDDEILLLLFKINTLKSLLSEVHEENEKKYRNYFNRYDFIQGIFFVISGIILMKFPG